MRSQAPRRFTGTAASIARIKTFSRTTAKECLVLGLDRAAAKQPKVRQKSSLSNLLLEIAATRLDVLSQNLYKLRHRSRRGDSPCRSTIKKRPRRAQVRRHAFSPLQARQRPREAGDLDASWFAFPHLSAPGPIFAREERNPHSIAPYPQGTADNRMTALEALTISSRVGKNISPGNERVASFVDIQQCLLPPFGSSDWSPALRSRHPSSKR
jgi:hypothetical protein